MIPPEPGEYQYFLGIGLPHKDDRFFSALKQYFHPRHHLSSPPHITIKPPFLYPNEPVLISKLTAWAKLQTPFQVTFQKIGVFYHKKYATVFLSPNKTQALKMLESSLTEKIALLPKTKNFYPHLTIANRAPLDQVDQIKHQLRGLNIKLKLKIESITLYRRQFKQSWQVYKVFDFKKPHSL